MSTPTGLLYSQVGYGLNAPQRAIIRGGEGTLGLDALYSVYRGEEKVLKGAVKYWGGQVGSQWWISDFSELALSGENRLEVNDPSGSGFKSGIFEMGERLVRL